MQFLNYQDLGQTLLMSRSKLPRQVDLIVGIPRSGMLPASMLAAQLNLPLADIGTLMDGGIFTCGETKKAPDIAKATGDDRTVLIIDDCVGSGRAFRKVRELVAASGISGNFVYCSVYSSKRKHPDVDVILETVPDGYIFPWNLMHHRILADACVDIDGVLCCNPIGHEVIGRGEYLQFLENAYPLHGTSGKIGWLVTSRAGKHREATESWLKRNNISYSELVMATDEEKADPASYKARVYRESGAAIFIESEAKEAALIASKANKAVICVETMHMVHPGSTYVPARKQGTAALKLTKNKSALKLWLRRVIGNKSYEQLKSLNPSLRTGKQ